jgi:LuxR family maltose regulon positive regulatory protein
MSEKKHQKIIQIGAARLLSSIAILKADADGWNRSLNAIELAAHGTMHNTSRFRAVLDVVRGTLLSELRDFDKLPDWLKSSEFMTQDLPLSIKRNAYAVNAIYLFSKGDFARLVGIGQAAACDRFSVFSEHFHSLLMALGFLAIGDRTQASAFLNMAAQKVLPDGMLHFFAGFSPLLQGLDDELIREKYLSLATKYSEYKEKYALGIKTLYTALVANNLPSGLTEREREIAALAADGMRNNEIAEMLFVSENTVRAHLRAIYQKLDIDRRAKLAKVLK